jgi:hypothetical protein
MCKIYFLIITILLFQIINCEIIYINNKGCIPGYCKLTCNNNKYYLDNNNQKIIINNKFKKGDIYIYEENNTYTKIEQDKICDYILHLSQEYKQLCISWNDYECQLTYFYEEDKLQHNGIIYQPNHQISKREIDKTKLYFSSKYIDIDMITNKNIQYIIHAAAILNIILNFKDPISKLIYIKKFSYNEFISLLINVISKEFGVKNIVDLNKHYDFRILVDLNDLLPVITRIKNMKLINLEVGDKLQIMTFITSLQNIFDFYNSDTKTSVICNQYIFTKNDCPFNFDILKHCSKIDRDKYLEIIYSILLYSKKLNVNCNNKISFFLGQNSEQLEKIYYLTNKDNNNYFCNNKNNFRDIFLFCEEVTQKNLNTKISGLIEYKNYFDLKVIYPERYIYELNKIITNNITINILQCNQNLKSNLLSVLSSIYTDLILFNKIYNKTEIKETLYNIINILNILKLNVDEMKLFIRNFQIFAYRIDNNKYKNDIEKILNIYNNYNNNDKINLQNNCELLLNKIYIVFNCKSIK